MSTPPSPLPSPAHDNGPDLNSHLSCEKKGRSAVAVVLRSRSRRSARAGQTSKVAPLPTSPLFVPFSIFSRLPDFHFHYSAAPFTTPPDSQFAFHSPPARSLLFPPLSLPGNLFLLFLLLLLLLRPGPLSSHLPLTHFPKRSIHSRNSREQAAIISDAAPLEDQSSRGKEVEMKQV